MIATSNPFTAIRKNLILYLQSFAPLAVLVPASRIQAWDRLADIRGEVESSPDLGARLWLRPLPAKRRPWYSSGSGYFERRYAVGYGCGSLDLEQIEQIEWEIERALAPGQAMSPAVELYDTAPLAVESMTAGDTDPEREPIDDPEEWQDVCEVTIVAFAPRAALLET